MRYLLHHHPAFSGLLSKDELYVLVERSSLARGDLCTDTATGRDHTVGEVISGMRPPRPSSSSRLDRPTYQEFRADSPEALEEWAEEEAGEDEPEAEPIRYTEGGEQIFFSGHPSWWRYSKLLFLVFLLVVAAGMLVLFDEILAVLAAFFAVVIFFCIYVIRRCHDYMVTEERIEVQWGLLGKNSNEVRICDIRSLDVREKGLKGLIGVGTLDVSTAANAGIEVSFQDIRKPHEIKEMIRSLQRGLKNQDD